MKLKFWTRIPDRGAHFKASEELHEKLDREEAERREQEEYRREQTVRCLESIALNTGRIADVLEVISDPQTARLRIEGPPR